MENEWITNGTLMGYYPVANIRKYGKNPRNGGLCGTNHPKIWGDWWRLHGKLVQKWRIPGETCGEKIMSENCAFHKKYIYALVNKRKIHHLVCSWVPRDFSFRTKASSIGHKAFPAAVDDTIAARDDRRCPKTWIKSMASLKKYESKILRKFYSGSSPLHLGSIIFSSMNVKFCWCWVWTVWYVRFWAVLRHGLDRATVELFSGAKKRQQNWRPIMSFVNPYAPWCWNMYQHLPQKSPSFVGFYIPAPWFAYG